ncbi:40S ribosomal protein S3-2 [Linum grandiflorum]
MESGAKGCDFIVSGKLRAQRAKSMKFKDGYMISSGHPVNEYINFAVRHVLLRQGVLGIKVKVMLDWDSKIWSLPPKEEEEYMRVITAMNAPASVADIEIPAPITIAV